MRVDLKRMDEAFHMEAVNENGIKMQFDIAPESGGHNKGVRPMQSLLMAMGGCSSVDIIMILKKQKQEIQDLQISIDGEREPNKEPSLWQTIHASFKLKGPMEKEKVIRAVQLSMDKYCSVSKTLEAAGAKITYDVYLNDEKIS